MWPLVKSDPHRSEGILVNIKPRFLQTFLFTFAANALQLSQDMDLVISSVVLGDLLE